MIRRKQFATVLAVYTCLNWVANPILAQTVTAPIPNLTLHETPVEMSNEPFMDPSGEPITIADFEGETVVINFWATWCAPCREEMPSLAELNTLMADKPVRVVAIATGPNPSAAVERFLEEIEATDLQIYTDPRQKFARSMGVLGLPATVIMSADGVEIARLVGEADWAAPEIVTYLENL